MAITFELENTQLFEKVTVTLNDNDPHYLAMKKLFFQANKAFPKDLDDDRAICKCEKKGWWEKWEKAYDKFINYLNGLICKAITSNTPTVCFTLFNEKDLMFSDDYGYSTWWGQKGDVSYYWHEDIYESIDDYRHGWC